MTQGWEAEVLNCPDIADNHDNYHYCDIGDNDDDNLHYYDTRRQRAILGLLLICPSHPQSVHAC